MSVDDLIADVRIDGKHSYEDTILAGQDFQLRYGDRTTVLGGIDLNILAAGTPDDVRCARALRDWVGVFDSQLRVGANYLAMADEADEANAVAAGLGS